VKDLGQNDLSSVDFSNPGRKPQLVAGGQKEKTTETAKQSIRKKKCLHRTAINTTPYSDFEEKRERGRERSTFLACAEIGGSISTQ